MPAIKHCRQIKTVELSQAKIERGFRDAVISIYGGDEKALERYMDVAVETHKEPERYIPPSLKYYVEVWPRIWTEKYGDLDAVLCSQIYDKDKNKRQFIVIFKSGLTDKRWMELMKAMLKATNMLWKFRGQKKVKGGRCPFCLKDYKVWGTLLNHAIQDCGLKAMGARWLDDYDETRSESLAHQQEELEDQDDSEVVDPFYGRDDDDDPCDWWKPCAV